MKGTDIFSVKGITKKMKLKKGESASSIYNNAYYLFKGARTGANAEMIDKIIKVVSDESKLLISELTELKNAQRKPRTSKDKAA